MSGNKLWKIAVTIPSGSCPRKNTFSHCSSKIQFGFRETVIGRILPQIWNEFGRNTTPLKGIGIPTNLNLPHQTYFLNIFFGLFLLILFKNYFRHAPRNVQDIEQTSICLKFESTLHIYVCLLGHNLCVFSNPTFKITT